MIGIVLFLAGTGTAPAAPGISAVYTEHSQAGVPLGINIVGKGFTCPNCPPPKVQLGGLSLGVAAHSANVITDLLPQPIPSGDYSLEVTSGPAQRAEVARFSLSIDPVPIANGGDITRPAFRPTTGPASQPPPPDRLRATLNPPTRSAGSSSRSGTSSNKVSGVVGAGAVATPLLDATTTADPVVTGLPPYNTGYGEYALFDLSRGYNNGTRGNSAFGYWT